jgi:putative ABC transport system ATP-binding protein
MTGRPSSSSSGARAADDGAPSSESSMRSDRSPPAAQELSRATNPIAARIFRVMIKAIGLTQTYLSGGRPLTVLKDINLTVDPQGFVAILGPSGSGKTTLLGLLAGLDNPTSGRVELDGQNIALLTEDERAKFRAERVGFVFQSFQLIPTLTAWENVVVPLELLGRKLNGDGGGDYATELLERVGLGDRTHHYPAQLSGGEQQRVALARAFANRPKILFADEPTGNLDTSTGKRIIDLLVELNEQADTTLVLVTHDLELARLAHRTVRVNGGEIVVDSGQDPT